MMGNEAIVKILLEAGADIQAEACEETLAIIHYASGSHLMIDECDPKNCKISIIEMLMSKGADVHARNTSGRTPIDFASDEGLTDIVEFLISHGANVNVTDNYNCTPLHRAAHQ